MHDVFELERTTNIPATSYILSYPHILSYFADRGSLDVADFVRGAHLVYGWMPTALDLYPQPPNLTLAQAASLLEGARTQGTISDEQLSALVRVVNNSLVGTSKLLHFVRPDVFPIWDNKIYGYVFEEKPHHYRLNKIAKFREFVRRVNTIRSDKRFGDFHASVNLKVGYEVSEPRAVELIMFLNTP
ncbi:MAG TPA: hypothetical protein VJX30_00495 [Terriglobales bacterium]|jgi:hypothetical protein|nr:hypothetical protein [Terriglobales bacterium]